MSESVFIISELGRTFGIAGKAAALVLCAHSTVVARQRLALINVCGTVFTSPSLGTGAQISIQPVRTAGAVFAWRGPTLILFNVASSATPSSMAGAGKRFVTIFAVARISMDAWLGRAIVNADGALRTGVAVLAFLWFLAELTVGSIGVLLASTLVCTSQVFASSSVLARTGCALIF
jgi:hypothetical protein